MRLDPLWWGPYSGFPNIPDKKVVFQQEPELRSIFIHNWLVKISEWDVFSIDPLYAKNTTKKTWKLGVRFVSLLCAYSEQSDIFVFLNLFLSGIYVYLKCCGRAKSQLRKLAILASKLPLYTLHKSESWYSEEKSWYISKTTNIKSWYSLLECRYYHIKWEHQSDSTQEL